MGPDRAGLALALLLPGLGLAGDPAAPAARPAWSEVRSWCYQLQRPDLAALAKAPADLLVLDYSRTGRPEGELSRAEVAALQATGKRVVAYMSIGEAEPYRFYWQAGWRPGNPAWIQDPNPDWPDNFPVEFWRREWQDLLLGAPGAYLDRILAAGFDGVYLDIVDGYEAFQDERPAAADEMRELVTRIARYARERAGADFGVFPQNALDLLEDRAYRSLITGLGKEETYFFPGDKPNPEADQRWEEKQLDRLVKAGKLVLTVDYCRKPKNIAQVVARARARGYVPYTGKVELDRIYEIAPRP